MLPTIEARIKISLFTFPSDTKGKGESVSSASVKCFVICVMSKHITMRVEVDKKHTPNDSLDFFPIFGGLKRSKAVLPVTKCMHMWISIEQAKHFQLLMYICVSCHLLEINSIC